MHCRFFDLKRHSILYSHVNSQHWFYYCIELAERVSDYAKQTSALRQNKPNESGNFDKTPHENITLDVRRHKYLFHLDSSFIPKQSE